MILKKPNRTHCSVQMVYRLYLQFRWSRSFKRGCRPFCCIVLSSNI